MSYTKNTWATGDTITAAKLNNMEDGIAGAGGYDLVFETNGDSLGSTEATLKSGSYADAAAKFLNGGYVTALVYGSDTRDSNFYAATFNVQGVYYDSYTEGDPIIRTYFTFLEKRTTGYIATTSGGNSTTAINTVSGASASGVIKRIDLESDGTVTVMQL